MRSSTSSPRVSMLPRYQKYGVSCAKDTEKQSMTHAEFMAFIEPFYELVKEKNFEELRKQTTAKNFNLKREIYSKLDEQLRERLCSSFVFSEDVEIEDISFDTDLVLKKSIKPLSMFSSVFEKHNVLENYRAPEYKAMLREYEHQVAVNNARRVAIADAVKKRIGFQAYFYAYDIMHTEIIELGKRMKTRKRKSRCEADIETIREYLRRIEEFHEAFGTPDQFPDNETDYSDVLSPDSRESEAVDPSMQYFV